MSIWTPGALQCRICSRVWPRHQTTAFRRHLRDCFERNADFVDQFRPPETPFEGDPELAKFAAEEGSVYNRRAGTRKKAM